MSMSIVLYHPEIYALSAAGGALPFNVDFVAANNGLGRAREVRWPDGGVNTLKLSDASRNTQVLV